MDRKYCVQLPTAKFLSFTHNFIFGSLCEPKIVRKITDIFFSLLKATVTF